MFYYLLAPLGKKWLVFNLFNYISFRAAGATVTALLIAFVVGPGIIRRLRAHKVGQVIRAEGPASHQSKRGTPTMGGLIILLATVVPTLQSTALPTPAPTTVEKEFPQARAVHSRNEEVVRDLLGADSVDLLGLPVRDCDRAFYRTLGAGRVGDVFRCPGNVVPNQECRPGRDIMSPVRPG